MANAILIHGWVSKKEYYDAAHPTASNHHWFPWLTKQLMTSDIHTVSVEMPAGYYPQYDIWKRELERFDIDEESILVGHSCGGGFLVRWLSENDVKVGKVVLVAPWLGYDVGDEPFDSSFFDFNMRPNIVQKTESLHILISDNDAEAIIKSTDEIISSVDNVIVRRLTGKGHFTLSSLGGEAFPELLEVITGGR